jgi:hypothetical protein
MTAEEVELGNANWSGRQFYAQFPTSAPKNPYDGRTRLGRSWMDGWRSAWRAAQKAGPKP